MSPEQRLTGFYDPKPGTLQEKLFQTRSEFVLLVGAYNAIHRTDDALRVQKIVADITELIRNEPDVTAIAWPPQILIQDKESYLLCKK